MVQKNGIIFYSVNPVSYTHLEIVYHEDINVGIAVALDTGLVVPVVKSADKLSLEEISVETKRLITLARAGDIGGDEDVYKRQA